MDTPATPTNRELIEQGFEAMNVRLDDFRDQMMSMHVENRERLDQINGKVGRAHELIAALQEAVSTLKLEFKNIRERWHSFRDSIQNYISAPRGGGSSDEKLLTRRELGWVIALIVGSITVGATVTIWVLSVRQLHTS